MNDFRLECQECGSHEVVVTLPDASDMEHPKLNYLCTNCGTVNQIDCKITGVSEDGKLQVAVGNMMDEPKLILS